MSSDPISGVQMATIRCVMAVIAERSYLKFLAFSGYLLFCAMIFIVQPVGAQAKDILNMNASSDEIMSQLKTRLNLTGEQEANMKPIIEDSIRKHQEIVKNGSEDRKAVNSQLQELRWSTDMKIGTILTEEQMKEYQKLREEPREKSEDNKTQSGRRSRSGGLRGF